MVYQLCYHHTTLVVQSLPDRPPPRSSCTTTTSLSSFAMSQTVSTTDKPCYHHIHLFLHQFQAVFHQSPAVQPPHQPRPLPSSRPSSITDKPCYHHIYVFLQSVPDRPQARSGCASITSSFVSTQFQTVPHHGPALLSPHYSRGPVSSSMVQLYYHHIVHTVLRHGPTVLPSHHPRPLPLSRLLSSTIQPLPWSSTAFQTVLHHSPAVVLR